MRTVIILAALSGLGLIGGLGWLWSSPAAGDVAAEAPAVPVQGRSFLADEPEPTPGPTAEVGSPGATAGGEAESAASGGGAPAHGDAAEKPTETAEGHPILTWEDVAYYDYELPEPVDEEGAEPTNEQIPADMMTWSGKKIGIEGHMVPLEVEDGRVHSFVLSRYFAGCCFGGIPMMNEWVEVEVADEKGADYLPFSPILTVGTFEVGEVIDEYGYVSSIYRLKAEHVEEVD